MSKMMIYALKGAAGGAVENVWGTELQVRSIDASDKDVVEQAKADGWSNDAQSVIDMHWAKQMQKENTAIKGQLASGANKARIDELEEQLATALSEIAGFEVDLADANTVIDEKIARIAKLETELAGALIDSAKSDSELKHEKAKASIQELAKDKSGNGKIDYEEMTNAELQALLDERKAEYNKRDSKDTLIQKARDSE